ncbi:HAMP domain-containing protein, partial [Corallococcus interemptor]|uniref:HAMP domain-containing protein n=1 Tax=Corallococcus interemptor TaxID=2316720 RepID=UPI0027BAE89B
LGLFVALMAGGGVFLLVRRMMAPLGALTAAAARVVAEGDFSGTLNIHSHDEIGQLATSFGEMMARLRAVLLALKNSAQELEATALELANSASDQNLAVTRQAAALHQTQIAARQLQESSRAAAQRATGVLREAEKAGAVGQAGRVRGGGQRGRTHAHPLAGGAHLQHGVGAAAEHAAGGRHHRHGEGPGGPVQRAGAERGHRSGAQR